jgi:hypothetical protein
VFAQLALGKGTEAAVKRTDVRIVDIPIDDVAHDIATDVCPQAIGRSAYHLRIIATSLKQPYDLAFGQVPAFGCSGKDPLHMV